MRVKRRLSLRGWQLVFVSSGAIFVAAAAALLPAFLVDFGIIVVPAALAAFVAVVTLFVIPVHTLPAVALATFAIIPARILPQEGPFGALPVTSVILVIWAVRRVVMRQGGPGRTAGMSTYGLRRQAGRARTEDDRLSLYKLGAVASGIAFVVWALFPLMWSTDQQTSTGWLTSFTAGALLPLAVGHSHREAELVRRTWLFLAGWLGSYAIVEAVLRANPIWGNLYIALGATDSQHWSVYRAEASFGHPLFAALFFAVACALGIGNWLTTNARWALLASIFSGLGLVATVSRGALLAGAVAVTFAFGASMVIKGEKRWAKFAILGSLAVVGIVGIFQFDAFTARNDSQEAELSALARDRAAQVTLQAANLTGWVGSGPGTSGITGRIFDQVVIENSLFQLLISVGIPGLLLFAGVIGFAFLHALNRRMVGEASALLAYAICISGFNAIDALRGMHLILGCLMILTLNAPRRPEGFVTATAIGTTRARRRPITPRQPVTPQKPMKHEGERLLT
ncbi:MAG: hypothetical protein JWQ68_2385 [Cryobacterium sp.]|jgi:hypothetical protein|nr:hypothetical protein [Cryobacterium sp.]